MKPADKRLLNCISEEVSHLHMYWKVYRQLYAENSDRLSLLNETGSLVFYILQHLLLDTVTLSFARLTDPPKTYGKSNRSIERLLGRIDGRVEPQFKREMTDLYNDLKSKCQVFRHRRNKAVAHSDLGTVLKLKSNPLPGISRAYVEDALKALRVAMNHYQYHYLSSSTMYEELLLPFASDGNFLTTQLQRAYAFRELENEGLMDIRAWKSKKYINA